MAMDAVEIAPLFRLVEEFGAGHEARPDVLSRGLSTKLMLSSGESDPYSDIYRGMGSSAFPQVQTIVVRVSKDGKVDSMIALMLGGGACVAMKDVQKHFGDFSDMKVPRPQQPKNAPIVYEYRRPWGVMNFAVSREGDKCLEMIRVEFPTVK